MLKNIVDEDSDEELAPRPQLIRRVSDSDEEDSLDQENEKKERH